MATAAAGLYLLNLSSWSGTSHATFAQVAAVVVVTGLCALLDSTRAESDDGTTARVAFVGNVTTLLILGPLAMSLVAILNALAHSFSDSRRTSRAVRVLLGVVTAGAATQAAGAAHALLGGTTAPLTWPWEAIPLAGAITAYCLITAVVADRIVPYATGSTTSHGSLRQALRGFPGHVIAAAIAVCLVELIQHQAWAILPVAALPLYFAWDAYNVHAAGLGREQRRLQVTGTADHGICLVDDAGKVTHWNDALALLAECPAQRAVGRGLADAVPALAVYGVARAVELAIATRSAQTVPEVPIASAVGTRTLHMTALPDADGATLVWRDVTAQKTLERTLRETAERFALVTDGSRDALWELDQSGQWLFVSPRWRELLGQSTGDEHVRSDEWFARVHPDDLASLTLALGRLTAGTADRFEHEHRLRHEDGSFRRVVCCGTVARNESRRGARIGGSLTDITASAVAREKSLSDGTRDPLTGLHNRTAFIDRLAQRLEDGRKRPGRFATLCLDLDRFKVINDSLGHRAGDELLVAVARRLESSLRPGDTLSRLAGDEFAVLLQTIGDEMQANVVAFRLQEALQAPFTVAGREVVTSASIGIAISRTDYVTAEEMMRDADAAMYHAKAHGKARHELFDVDMHVRATDRLGIEGDLRQAVKSSDFEVHYQPIVSLASRMCIGFESLVRWNRRGKAVSPADFIPLAEELGIVEPLGTWVMQQACEKFVDWKKRFPASELDCITVNVSARQLVQQGFTYIVEQTIERNGMNPADLRIEITETALLDAPQLAAQVLGELRGLGVKIYLDDFGTGYSSLSHLHKLPVDALKIDRSFIRGLMRDDRPAIVESILGLARTLHTSVVAEGVEEELQAAELERLGCQWAQGYYFSRPVAAAAIEELLAAQRPLGGSRLVASRQLRAEYPKALPVRDIA